MLTSNVCSKLRYDILCHKYFLHKWRHTVIHCAIWHHLSSLPHQFSIFEDVAGWQPRTITLLKFVVDKKLASINICTAVWLKQKKTNSISYLQDFYGIFQQFKTVLKLSSTQNHLSKFYLHVLGREPFLSAWNADT